MLTRLAGSVSGFSDVRFGPHCKELSRAGSGQRALTVPFSMAIIEPQIGRTGKAS